MAVKFSEEWYRLQMPPLKAAFEDDAIALIKDADHVTDLRAVKLVRGIARVPALRVGETGKKRHGDHAISIALAHFASRMRWSEYSYTAIANAQTETAMFEDAETGWWRSPLGNTLRGSL